MQSKRFHNSCFDTNIYSFTVKINRLQIISDQILKANKLKNLTSELFWSRTFGKVD